MKAFDERKTHESYGLVQFNKINGSFTNLFGTNVDSSTAIALRVKRGNVKRGLSSTWYGEEEELIEVILSPNQFSELLTTMNCGVGVPCTIQHVAGKRAEAPPQDIPDTEKVRNEFAERMKEIDSKMNEFGQEIVKILDKKSINKSDKSQIIDHLRMLHREVGANFPFVLECFQESANDIVKEAKSVVDDFVANSIHNAGIKAIKDNNGIVSIPKLSQATDEEMEGLPDDI